MPGFDRLDEIRKRPIRLLQVIHHEEAQVRAVHGAEVPPLQQDVECLDEFLFVQIHTHLRMPHQDQEGPGVVIGHVNGTHPLLQAIPVLWRGIATQSFQHHQQCQTVE